MTGFDSHPMPTLGFEGDYCIELKRLDQGHLHPKLEDPGLTCPGWQLTSVGVEHSRKEPFEQLVNSYSEHLHMSARPVENARESDIFGFFQYRTSSSFNTAFASAPQTALCREDAGIDTPGQIQRKTLCMDGTLCRS
jgi:hypothetical protein